MSVQQKYPAESACLGLFTKSNKQSINLLWDHTNQSPGVKEVYAAQPPGDLNISHSKPRKCWNGGNNARYWGVVVQACYVVKEKATGPVVEVFCKADLLWEWRM